VLCRITREECKSLPTVGPDYFILPFTGCCWAFSSIAAVEGIVQITTGKLLSLSEQELVRCDTADGNSGCEGGLMYPAFGYT
jgi:hypothetical protein